MEAKDARTEADVRSREAADRITDLTASYDELQRSSQALRATLMTRFTQAKAKHDESMAEMTERLREAHTDVQVCRVVMDRDLIP